MQNEGPHSSLSPSARFQALANVAAQGFDVFERTVEATENTGTHWDVLGKKTEDGKTLYAVCPPERYEWIEWKDAEQLTLPEDTERSVIPAASYAAIAQRVRGNAMRVLFEECPPERSALQERMQWEDTLPPCPAEIRIQGVLQGGWDLLATETDDDGNKLRYIVCPAGKYDERLVRKIKGKDIFLSPVTLEALFPGSIPEAADASSLTPENGAKRIDAAYQAFSMRESAARMRTKRAILRQLPQNWNAQTAERLGIPVIDGAAVVDTESGETLKAANPEYAKKSGMYPIVRVGQDRLLLKGTKKARQERSIVMNPRDPDFPSRLKAWMEEPLNARLEPFTEIVKLEQERIASRLGKVAGYPVLPAEIVWWDGACRITTPLVPEARDTTRLHPWEHANPDEVRQRPLFNLWIDAAGDSSCQAITDPADGRYIAVDMSTCIFGPDMRGETDERRMEDVLARDYGPIRLDAESLRALRALAERIAGIGDAELEQAFAGCLLTPERRDQALEELRWRREHIRELLERAIRAATKQRQAAGDAGEKEGFESLPAGRYARHAENGRVYDILGRRPHPDGGEAWQFWACNADWKEAKPEILDGGKMRLVGNTAG